jgi:hypothetical protein
LTHSGLDRWASEAEHRANQLKEASMLYSLFGYVHARAHQTARRFVEPASGRFRGTAGERGQGTVEYVGLILLVSLLMVDMVAAMKGFNNKWPLGGLPAKA